MDIITSLDKKVTIVILVIALLAGGMVLYRRFVVPQGERAVIEVNNRRVQTVPLGPHMEKRQITVQGVNGASLLEVDGAFIRMVESACPDKVCIHMGRKSQPGDVIVCLPNRVVVKIEGAKD